MSSTTHCGYVAIVGRPNVGKSTLLNAVIEQKISITADKPQTTRHQVIGIKTYSDIQTIYVDTPGLHSEHKKALNRYLYHTAIGSLHIVDVVVFMVEALKWLPDDDFALSLLTDLNCPVVLAVNKVDKLHNKDHLLPFLEQIKTKYRFTEIIPLSAQKHKNLEKFEKIIASLLPVAPFAFPIDQVTTRSERFLVSEIIREKLTRFLGEEVPHELTVEIEEFKEEEKFTKISAVIYVERKGQKIIVIGSRGERLKEIGTRARLDIEKMLGRKVFLRLWVKLKRGWSDDERILQSLGYKNN